MCDGDFDPSGWGPDRDAGGVEGNVGCALFFIGIFIFGISATVCGC